MSSPENIPVAGAPLAPLLAKEMRDLFAGRAFWVLLLILSFLVGYSFIAAVGLYTEASSPAAESPELARGLSPFDGVLVPTFGALYLATTFLFPFVAIRTIGAEKQNGGQKLLLQMPYRTVTIIVVKLGALAFAWAAMVLPCLSAVVAWAALGGHVFVSEVAILLLGYFLYAAVIAGLSLVAAALAAAATAAIIALAFTLGFWVLDFAAAGRGGLLSDLAALSLTAVLHIFERGILSLGTLLATAIAVAGLATLAGVLLHPGRTLSRRTILSIATMCLTVLGLAAAGQVHIYADATENRRNSFAAADAATLATLHDRLTIIVNLAPEDPRFIDFERGVLGKLRRTMPDVEIVFPASRRSGLFSASDEDYGQISFQYGGQEAISRSTAAGEVLPLIYGLAGVEPPVVRPGIGYTGYPLVADARLASLWFYAGLPLLILAAWALHAGLLRRVRDAWSRA